MKRLLMLAFHFPPAAAGSGPLRTLGFARYLPVNGWEASVLTASEWVYARTAATNDGLIPDGCNVYRAPALDVQRHLSIRGKYFGFLAQPDRWSTWWAAAVWKGLRIIRRERIGAIWSTYPIMTAHCVAYTLHALTHLPWIADFRDPVSTSAEPDNPFTVRSQRRWEQRVLRRASAVTLTTPGARDAYAAQYPEAARSGRLAVIQNGYDEADFMHLPTTHAGVRTGPLVLLHSGVLYPDGRDPSAFFGAIAALKRAGVVDANTVRIVLRASGHEARYQQQLDRLGIADLVTLAPAIGNHEALVEQAQADALLLFQGNRFDRQIPAKLYEYLRIGKPIFALVGMRGDTAGLLRDAGVGELVDLHDEDAIQDHLGRFIARVACGEGTRHARLDVTYWSRLQRSTELARLLDQLVSEPAGIGSCA